MALLVEDDPGDQELARRAIQGDFIITDLHVVHDGEGALDFLHQRGTFTRGTASRPDLVVLGHNRPKVGGDL